MFYNFDTIRWFIQQLPGLLRRPVILSFCRAIAAAFSHVTSAFTEYASLIESKLSYNAFTIYLQRALNEALGLPAGTVYIEDYYDDTSLYLALREENLPPDYISLKPGEGVYVSSKNDISGGFVVNIPYEQATDEHLYMLRTLVDTYKYAGTQYIIKTY